jgi:hypothetical protein
MSLIKIAAQSNDLKKYKKELLYNALILNSKFINIMHICEKSSNDFEFFDAKIFISSYIVVFSKQTSLISKIIKLMTDLRLYFQLETILKIQKYYATTIDLLYKLYENILQVLSLNNHLNLDTINKLQHNNINLVNSFLTFR